MGIPGLTRYVDTLPVWESFDLYDTKLVIDGCGLYYYIYANSARLNTKYGGQYDQFRSEVKGFFAKLQMSKVIPYVVIDGIMNRDEKKFKTHVKRKTDIINRMRNMWTRNSYTYEMVLPRLVQLVFVQVLREIKIPYAIADFEADCEIASLANELDAPVMGSDSDFYIFNIKHGYIPFQQYDFAGRNTRVKKFSFDGFSKHLSIEPEMSPLLASLVGNDYISDAMLRPFNTHIQQLVNMSKLDAGSRKCKVPPIAQFLSKYKSTSEACQAVINLYGDGAESAFVKALHLSIKEYQIKQSNLIGYFVSGSLCCNVFTYSGHSLPKWVVKLYREGLIASEGLACLCNRQLFLRPQCEDVSLPSAQTCAEGLRWHYYELALGCELATTVLPVTEFQSKSKSRSSDRATGGQIEEDFEEILEEFDHKLNMKDEEIGLPSTWNKSIEHHKMDNPRKATSNMVKETNSADCIVAIEFDREGSTLARKKVNLTPQAKPQIHDVPKMSDAEKKSHLLMVLDSDKPFIQGLPLKHQLVASALRYWFLHSQNLKPAHLAALLVHYVGEKQNATARQSSTEITIQAVHGFSQWQNVLYWVERLNALFCSTFPTPELSQLYDGLQVCLMYERLRKIGIRSADTMVTNAGLYHYLYDVITKDLPADCQFNQSHSSQKRPNKRGENLEKEMKTKGKSSEWSKGNRFGLLCPPDSDDDSV